MGTYVYSVRSVEFNVELRNGKKVVARGFRYLCKPYYFSFGRPKNDPSDALMARAESAYSRKGTAEYIVFVNDDNKVDMYAELREWDRDYACVYDSSDEWSGKFVGYVAKEGRGQPYKVVPRETVELYQRQLKVQKMKEGMYSCGQFGSDWEAYTAFLNEKDNGKPGSFPANTYRYPEEK